MKSQQRMGAMVAVLASAVLVAGAVQAQTTGTWITDGGGDWSAPANWASGNVANGIGATANFDPPGGLSVNAAVVLDSDRSLTKLIFKDSSDWLNEWFLSPGTPGDPEKLTLDGDNPEIEVRNSRTGGSATATEGVKINVPVEIGGNGAGSATFKAPTPAGGRLPVLIFNDTVESSRNLVLTGSFGHIFLKDNLTLDGNLSITGDNTIFRLDGSSNSITGTVTINASSSSVYVKNLSQNIPMALTAGTLSLIVNADIRLSGLTGSGSVNAPGLAPSANATLRLNLTNGVHDINASMGWVWVTFYKEGSGTARLNNQWRPSKGAFIEGGTLVVNHANALVNPDSPFTVTVRDGATLAVGAGITFTPPSLVLDSGASLGGHGTYSRSTAWTVPAGVSLSPGVGTDTGTLTVNTGGNAVTFSTGARLEIDFNAAGTADTLEVDGSLNLTNSGDTLVLRGTIKDGPFVVAQASGGITGEFDAVDTTGLSSAAEVTYPGDGTIVVSFVPAGTVIFIQ